MTCDPPVSAVGDAGDVLAHVLLEVAGGLLHGHLLGAIERRQRQLVDARPALQPCEPLLDLIHRLGQRRDALGIDGVLVDAALRLALGLDGRLAFLLRLPEGLLRPHPGRGRVVGHATKPGQGMSRLVHLGRRAVALGGEVAAHVDALQHPPQLGAQLLDGGAVGRLAFQQRIARVDVRDTQRRQQRIALPARQPQLLLLLGPAPQPALDLRLLELHLAPHVAAAR